MWSESQMSSALQQLRPLIADENFSALDTAIHHLGLDFVLSNTFIEYCRRNRQSAMVIFLATLSAHNVPNVEAADASQHDRRGPQKDITLTLCDGVQISVPNSLKLITPYVLIEQQDWFEDEIRFVRHLLQPGQKVIDVGANYGVYTLSMAQRVGPTGSVYSFEPTSSTAAMLEASISVNHFAQITLDRSALSNRCGTAQFSLNEQSELNTLTRDEHSMTASETVSLFTLDDRLRRYKWTDISFMKIDAEGEESNILKGGTQFFSELSPLIQYEIKAGTELHLELVREFAALGYASYRLVPGLSLLVPFNAELPVDAYLLNLFCCKQDRAEILEKEGLLLMPKSQVLTTGFVEKNDAVNPSEENNRYTWHQSMAHLPYGVKFANLWNELAAGDSAEVLKVLSIYARSQDATLGLRERFDSLEMSFNLLHPICGSQNHPLRLASLARIAKELGARAIAVNALNQLNNHILEHKHITPSEPFLIPGKRFELISFGENFDKWLHASVLEEIELLESYSSFYTGAAPRNRLESIRKLGFSSPEMNRRLSLVESRFPHRI